MDLNSEHITLTFEQRVLCCYLSVIFVRAAVACAILKRTFGFEPSPESTAPWLFTKLCLIPCQMRLENHLNTWYRSWWCARYFFKHVLEVTLFYVGHLDFEPSLFFMTTDEADGSQVLVAMYVTLFREYDNCYRVHVLVHKPVWCWHWTKLF